MVNIFIIHSGKDRSKAEEIKSILIANEHANVLLLDNRTFWKIDAKNKIKKSQVILYIVGDNSFNSKNIDWELKQSIKLNKIIYVYKLNDNNKINDVLRIKDKFSNKTIKYEKEIDDINVVSNRITKYENGEYDILNFDPDKIDVKQLIDQYKIYLQTSENLVSRRQSVSSFYITVNTALISVSAVLIALFNDINEKATIILILSIMGIVLDISWHKILEAYGVLNSSKMKVISIIEKKLPVNLYDSEWEIMCDKLSNRKYVSFTDSEKRIPIIFASFYSIAFIICIILLICK